MRNKNFIEKNGIYHHVSGEYRIRERKGRNLEVCFTSRPNKWSSCGTTDLFDAEVICDNMLKNKGRLSSSMKKSMLFRDYAKNFFRRDDKDSFYARRTAFGFEPTDKYMYENQSRLDKYIMPALGDMPIAMITMLDVEEVYLNCVGVNGKPLGDNSKNKIRQTMISIFDMAVIQRIIDTNPARESQHIRERKAKERKVFSVDEIKRLFPNDLSLLEELWKPTPCINVATGSAIMWATYFSIMYDTGFRPGEVIALSIDSFKGNGVYTECSVDNITGKIKNSIKTSSTGQRFKVGILSDYTQTLVRLLINETEGEYPFTINGKFIRIESANKRLKEVLAKAGIPVDGRVQYCMRHSFDTNMLDAMDDTMDIDDVKMLMGHRVYRPEYDHRKAERIIDKLDIKVRDKINRMR